MLQEILSRSSFLTNWPVKSPAFVSIIFIETRTFSDKASKAWTPKQYEDFILYIANNPKAREVVPGSGGVRKIRWSKTGAGKRGGVRVIYFNSSQEETWLLTMYVKMSVRIFQLTS